jgi:hypothetical protein
MPMNATTLQVAGFAVLFAALIEGFIHMLSWW